MKKTLLVFIFFISFSITAQNAQDIIDGLKKELKSNPDAKKTATIYSDLTWYYSNVSIDSALHYSKKAIESSLVLKDSTLLSQVYSDVGAVYFRKGDYQNSKLNYLKAFKIRKLRNDLAGMNKVNANLANIYNKEGKRTLALKSYLETIDYFEKTANNAAAAIAKSNVGFLFHELKNYPKARHYLTQAVSYQEKNNLETDLCTSYLTLGNVYLKEKDTINALKYYNKSVLVSKKTANKAALSGAMVNIGAIKEKQKKSLEANTLFVKSKELRDSLNIKNEESILSLLVINEKIKQEKYEESKKDLLKLKSIYENNSNDEENLLKTYQYLASVYGYLKVPDSTNYFISKSNKIQIAILDATVIKQTNELETKYQTAKKEKQIIQQQAEVKKRNLYLVGLSGLILLLGIIAYLINRQQKQKLAQQEQEYQLKNAISQIETQNKLQEQRLSISRDLHDNIGAQLTFIISSVDNVKYAFDITNEKLDQKLTNISSFAKETILELRDTIWAMNHNEISYEDLEIRINNYIEKAKQSKDQISFSFAIEDVLKTKRLTSVEGMNIYRTIQEAINNAIKYANASIISVNVKEQDGQTKITISDNGSGFDTETTESGNGLQNMKKRIEEIGGKFHLSSSNNGTQIAILI